MQNTQEIENKQQCGTMKEGVAYSRKAIKIWVRSKGVQGGYKASV